MQKVIEASNVSKVFKGKVVLHQVNFSLEKGEIHSLLGPNGAGKSTLMKLIIGIEKPSEGTILFLGEKLSGKQRIGVVPQEEFFYKNFSVLHNLKLFGKMFNVFGKDLDKRINFLLKWLELSEFKNTEAGLLSGGYRRLLNIGCSIIHNPEIIFLDEPTVALDPSIRKLLWKKILELKKEGKTILLTTHYLDEAEYLSDRVSILFKGSILETDSPQGFLAKHGGKELIKIQAEGLSKELILKLKKILPSSSIKLTNNFLLISFNKKASLKYLSKINSFLNKNKIKIQSSLIKEPELEDVFLKLTGEKAGE